MKQILQFKRSASRRVVIHDESPLQEAALTHKSIELALILVKAQPYAHPARPKLQRSRVLARRQTLLGRAAKPVAP